MKKGIKELFELVDKNTSEPTTDMAENLSI
jgi:hypothetical protein